MTAQGGRETLVKMRPALFLLLCAGAACSGDPLVGGADAAPEREASTPDVLEIDAGCAPEPAAGDLISDFEGASASLLLAGGRAGAWRPVSDGSSSGILVPSSVPLTSTALTGGPRCGSERALRLLGDGWWIWGAGAVAELAAAGAVTSPYDAAARGYRGVELWLRGQGLVRLVFWDAATVPAAGPCAGSGAEPCGDPFAVTVRLSGEWRRLAFAWEDLRREGEPAALLDTAHLIAIGLLTTKNTAFDVWLDDPAFVR